MSKLQKKIKIFENHQEKFGNSITGKVISLDFDDLSGLFWVHSPKNLKNKLSNGRHTPNKFDFKDINESNSNIEEGFIISCNFSINKTKSGKELKFFNVKTKEVKKTKKNSLNDKKRNRSNKLNKSKPRPRVFMLFGHSSECTLLDIDGRHSLDIINDKSRINLKEDFKDVLPYNNKIKFLNGQLSGRMGLTNTSFSIMEFMQNSDYFRDLIYTSKNMNDMKELDNFLNIVSKTHAYYGDGQDTHFGIYPRTNKNGTTINGPKDSNITFVPSSSSNDEHFYNGSSWPLGIYELPIFDTNDFYTSNQKYTTLFKNYKGTVSFKDTMEPGWDFFSVIKNPPIHSLLRRGLLLDIPQSSEFDQESEYLDMLKPEIDEITKYNKFLMNKINKPEQFYPNRYFPVSYLIRNIIRLADIKPDEEIIFISNVCRSIHSPDNTKPPIKGQLPVFNQMYNPLVGKKTKRIINILRRNSRGGTRKKK